MIQKFAEKVCNKIDTSPKLQKIIEITPREEKIAKRLFIPAVCLATWLIFLMASAKAEAAQPDSREFFTVHELKPVLTLTRDSGGQPVNTVNQVDLLVQLPGELVARRIRAPLHDTLFLDPRAPAPGERTYQAVVGLDGQLETDGDE